MGAGPRLRDRRHTLALAQSLARVVALDPSPEMLARARLTSPLPVDLARHAFPAPLPFRDSLFDLAVLGLVAEHIANLPAMLREVARVLRPGGQVLLSALHPDRTADGQCAGSSTPATASAGRSSPIIGPPTTTTPPPRPPAWTRSTRRR